MRIQRIKKRSNKLAYLPVLIIMLSLTIITASTFAFFADKGGASGTVNFGKVELSDGTSAGVTRTLYDTMPGDAIIDNTLSFSKSSDSESIFVRAKLSFSTDSLDTTTSGFLATLRGFDASDFGISNAEIGTTGAKWSAKTGNYVYLVNADDETTLFNVTSDTTYTLSNSIIVPTELTQSLDEDGESTFAHYMESIKFNFAFQAIQSSNVDNILATTSATFSEAFPESASEIMPVYDDIPDGMTFLLDDETMTAMVKDYTGDDSEIVIPSAVSGSSANEIICTIDNIDDVWNKILIIQLYLDDAQTNEIFDNIRFGYVACPYDVYATVYNCYPGDSYTVTSIGSSAFSGCSSVSSVIIPASVTIIEYGAFANCPLISITVDSGNQIYTSRDDSGVEINGVIEISSDTLVAGCSTTTMPDTILAIGASAFASCSGLITVTVPESVVSIGDYAFDNCTNMTSISIPNSVLSIGSSAFWTCSGLLSIILPESLQSIGQRAFAECSGLLSMVIPESVISIEESAFYCCSNLSAIEIPDSVTSIENNAFNGCANLTIVTIPDAVRTIGESSFSNCSALTSIYIPVSVTNFGFGVFNNSYELADIYYFGTEEQWNSIVGVDNIGLNPGYTTIHYEFTYDAIPEGMTFIRDDATMTAQVSGYTGSATNLVIPRSFSLVEDVIESGVDYLVTSIGSSAFQGCDAQSITIPNSIRIIGDHAFTSCNALTSITIPSSVTIIDSFAFANCSNMTLIIIPDSVTSIGGYAFNSCSNLADIYFAGTEEEWDTSIGEDGNSGIGLTEYTTIHFNYAYEIPEGMTFTIDEENMTATVSGYTGTATEISIPNAISASSSVQTICTLEDDMDWMNYYMILWESLSNEEYMALMDAIHMETITYPYNVTATAWTFSEGSTYTVTSIGEYAFQGCYNLSTINLPDSLEIIGQQAFDGCQGLASITIPNLVTNIGNAAFRSCTSLTTVTLPETLAVLPSDCFSSCSILMSISLPDSLTTIGVNAFYATGLTSISIPANVSSIGSGSFAICPNLTEIVVISSEYGTYTSRNASSAEINGIIEISSGTLITGCSTTEIPDSVTNIGDYAFSGRSGLTSITIPNSVTSIGQASFQYCSNLTSITISEFVTSIGNAAFMGCSSLVSISLPNTVTSIVDWTFSECSSLTSITITNSTTSVLANAFDNCTALTTVNYYGTEEQWNSISISTNGNSSLTNATINYIYDIPEGMTFSFDSETMTAIVTGYTGTATSIVIPKTCSLSEETVVVGTDYIVTSIGDGAFTYCDWILDIAIPNSVTIIGSNAFADCFSLASIIIPNSITSIESYAFSSCSSLTAIIIPVSIITFGSDVFSGCSVLSDIYFIGSQAQWESIPNYNNLGLNLQYTTIHYNYGSIPEGMIFTWDNNTMMGTVTAYNGFATDIEIPRTFSIEDGIVVEGNDYLVTSIGYYAFYCRSITSILIPDSVTLINGVAFVGCASLNTIIVDSKNLFYTSRDGSNNESNCIVEKATNTLISGCKNTVIPDSVTIIGYQAFYNCSGLTSITLPNSIIRIESEAFHNCSNLSSMIVSDNIEFISLRAIPLSVCQNNGSVFYLTSSSGLSSYVIQSYNTSITSITWPSNVKVIAVCAFQWCNGLTTIVIPSGVTSIDDSSFYGCAGLTSITMPESVTSIGSSAFDGCTSLISIIIPNSITSIVNQAFYRCSSLSKVYYTGTAEEWTTLTASIEGNNTSLTDAPRYYFTSNGSAETASGNWWYYDVDGITIVEKIV